ncbi:hypothetical protein T01_10158 [Trichinella spiralis]|uniref:Uncharacterized protein n=1 Tax=Trichinella spiralis TaxID=6334 RepID=A0A0V1BVW6_TRISP|nr:hypothetical protein T01_10158 [Trichinella spiralis]
MRANFQTSGAVAVLSKYKAVESRPPDDIQDGDSPHAASHSPKRKKMKSNSPYPIPPNDGSTALFKYICHLQSEYFELRMLARHCLNSD